MSWRAGVRVRIRHSNLSGVIVGFAWTDWESHAPRSAVQVAHIKGRHGLRRFSVRVPVSDLIRGDA